MTLFTQIYNPLGNQFFSTIVAGLPVLVLFLMLVVVRAEVPLAAGAGAIVAFLIATLVYHMPMHMAALAFWHGTLFAMVPTIYVIIWAMLLYNMTVETGCFDRIKASVAGISPDHRLQAVLIAFCFGAFLEGAAGAGTPVAICAAMLVGLGFNAFQAACICLLANTSPVAYGGFGTPLLTLTGVTGIDTQLLSHMAGNQLPILSCIVPLWLVRFMCKWKETLEVLPAILVAGGTFAISQYIFAHSPNYPLTDLAGGLIALIVTAIFLNFWKPKTIWRYETHHKDAQGTEVTTDIPAKVMDSATEPGDHPIAEVPGESEETKAAAEEIHRHVEPRMSLMATLHAWMPFIILCIVMISIGVNKKALNELHIGPLQGQYKIHIGGLDKLVLRTPPVVEKPTLEDAVFTYNWITTPGTSIVIATILSFFYLRVTGKQLINVLKRTYEMMKIPVPTIVAMIGLAYITRYAGLDATLGLAFKNTGVVYPFFAAMLGWLGVFLTGSDSGSNALFGSLQKITAYQLNLNPVLICMANSSGGVMGKMIDAQSICVATAATGKIGTEADIFKKVLWHSVALAAIVGLIVLLQAYVPPFTHMVPK